jgi:hypothetical protein
VELRLQKHSNAKPHSSLIVFPPRTSPKRSFLIRALLSMKRFIAHRGEAKAKTLTIQNLCMGGHAQRTRVIA